MKEVEGIKMYSASEIAKKMGVSTAGVYRMVRSGKMAATKIGRNIMISEDNLKNYLNGKY